jgi:hypothetical protein
VWSRQVVADAKWTVSRDPAGNVYLAGTNGMLAQYSNSGDQSWSNNFASPCVAMVVDASGNRFVSLADGTVGHLQSDGTRQPPGISSAPTDQTVFAGDNVVLTFAATGTEPLAYAWRFNGTNLSGVTGTQLVLNPVTTSQSGSYSVVVTNLGGAITSTPALVRVKSVQLYWGAQLLTNGNYVFSSPPTLTIRSAFTSGARFYTLDGTAPTSSSTAYAGPFQLNHNATVRAIGYSANSQQSEEADPITATVFSQHTLTTTISGGGTITLSPPGGTYLNTTTVTATAIPAVNWSFLFWLDDASGTSPSIPLSMEEDRSILAVFGTNSPAGLAAPGLAWRANLAAKVFSVDAQTNVYANAGGTVFKLTSGGTPLQTNAICPLPGVAKRDDAGNYYFAGSIDGTQDFGGITLVGGWTNWNGHQYSPGWPTVFLAKYAANGNLQWVVSFGSQGPRNTLTDLALDPSGGCYVGYELSSAAGMVTHVSETGLVDWTWAQPVTLAMGYALRLGGATSSNCAVLALDQLPIVRPMFIDRAGNTTTLGATALGFDGSLCTNTVPVRDDLGNLYNVGWGLNTPGEYLIKCAAGVTVWTRQVVADAKWTVGRDPAGNVYLAGTNGMLAQYSNSGDQSWSNNFASPCVAMVVDASGNRFVSLADGTVGRLQSDAVSQAGFSATMGSGTEGIRLSLVSKPEQIWQVQVSTNLTSWVTVGVVTNIAGGLQFSDPTIKKAQQRFYRTVPWP